MKVLLDTSFLLPVFGVDVDVPRFKEQLLHLSKEAELLVNSLSILEAKWIILRISKKRQDVLEEFKKGLNLVTRGETLRIVPFYSPEIDTVATFVYRHHRDYIDCSILASAYVEADIFVTMEKKKMKELAELIYPELSAYRQASSKLIVATLSEAVRRGGKSQ